MDEDVKTDALRDALNPERWRCSMCGGLNTTLVIVPKHHNVHFALDDDGNNVPLLVKLHPGACQEAWERYGKPDDQTISTPPPSPDEPSAGGAA